MTLYRGLVVCLTAVWLAPAGLAVAAGAHVAFAHSTTHRGEHRAAHAGAPHAAHQAPLALGHVHAPGDAEHEHPTRLDAGTVARARPTFETLALSATPISAPDDRAAPLAGTNPPPAVPPPRASGPPLLARLSVFRI